MIDIDKWGPPPPITDNVNHGDLLVALNELGFKVQIENAVTGSMTGPVMEQLASMVNDFIPRMKDIIESHTLSTGTIHGETKSTVALQKKDNFRMATIDECRNLANVNAFVHPAGVTAALEGISLNLSETHQQNDIFPIAVLSNQLMFKHGPYYTDIMSDVVRGVGMVGRYKDNLILSPRQSGNSTKTFSVFKGFNAGAGTNNRFYDTGGVKFGLKGSPENPNIYQEIGAQAAGRVVVIPENNPTKTGVIRFQLTTSVANADSLTGLIADTHVGPGLTRAGLRHLYLETASNVNSFPISSAYACIAQENLVIQSGSPGLTPTTNRTFNNAGSTLFTNMYRAGVWAGINIASICKSNDPNVVLTFEKYFTSMCWEVMGKSYILKLQGVIKHRNNATGKSLFLNFSCAMRATITRFVDNVATKQNIVYTPVYFFAPTVLNENNLASFNSGYTRLFEKGSVLDTVAHPGSIIEGGLYVRLQTYPQHSYVHYTRLNDINSILDYFKTPINSLDGYWVNTIPLAHTGLSPFGNTPQRLIPIDFGADGLKMLSYGLDNSIGGFNWNLLTWNDPTLARPRTSWKVPDKAERINSTKMVPSSITSTTTDGSVAYHGLNFVEANNYTGLTGVTFVNDGFTSTGEVKLNGGSLASLMQLETAFLTRAKAYYNNTDSYKLLDFTVGVFTIDTLALVVLTDGFGYMEIGLANYTIANNIYTIATPVPAINFAPVTATSKPTVFVGEKAKSDTYQNDSHFSDLNIYQASGNMILSFNRPWGGDRIGKVTLTINNINPTTLLFQRNVVGSYPVKLVGQNTPEGVVLTKAQVRDIYQSSYVAVPVVNSLPYEACDIYMPNKQVYVNKLTRSYFTRMTDHHQYDLNGTAAGTINFDFIQGGDVVVPSGYPVVLSGRAMKTYRDTSYNTSSLGWHTYYLQRDGLNLSISRAEGEFEPQSDRIKIAEYSDTFATNVLVENELVINGLKMSYERSGSSFPVAQFYDAAGNELYGFFFYNDAPHYPPRFEVNLPTTKTVYATENGGYSVDIYSRVPPIVVDWYVQKPGNAAVKVAAQVPTTALGNNLYRCSINYTFEHWDLTNSKIWCEAFDERPESTLSTVCDVKVTRPIFNFTTNLQPTSTVDYNNSITYNVIAESQAGIATYTWYQRVGSQTNQIGGNANSVTLMNQNNMFNGSTIWCVVRDNSGQEITSVVCTQTVRMPNLSFVTNNVATKTVMEGGTTQLSVVVTAEVGVSQYQWYLRKGGVTTPVGDNDRVLAILSANYAWDKGELFVVVTDNVGQQITSVACVLTVIKAILAFTVQPASTTIAWDDTANFSTTVNSNIGSLVYVWKLDGAVVGGNSRTLSLPNRRTNGTVVVEVTDGFGNKITSNPATIVVNAPQLYFVNNLPPTRTIAYNAALNLTVLVASGAGVKTYEWYHQLAGGDPVLVGGNEPSLSLPNQRTAQNNSKVWCVVTDNINQVITTVQCVNTVAAPIFRIVGDLPLVTNVHYNGTATYSFNTVSEAGVLKHEWYHQKGNEPPSIFATQSSGLSTTVSKTNQKTIDNGTKVWCVSTDNEGNVITSQTSSLVVNAPHLYFANNLPPTRTIVYNTTLNLTVLVNPDAEVKTYEWYQVVGGVANRVGGNEPSLSLPNQKLAQDQSSIYVVVTDNENKVIKSVTCLLTVKEPVLSFMTNNVATKSVGYNATATYSVSVNTQAGVGSYTWYQKKFGSGSTAVVVGHGSSVSLPTQRATHDQSTVWCVVVDNEGFVITSTIAVQTVNLPYITVDLPSVVYHRESATPRRFTLNVMSHEGNPTFQWLHTPAGGTSKPITTGITSARNNSVLDFVMDNAAVGFEKITVVVTYDGGEQLVSTTSTVYINTQLIFNTNLSVDGGSVMPGETKSYVVSVTGGTGNPTFTWYKQYINPAGQVQPETNELGGVMMTMQLTGEVGGKWRVWVVARDPIMGDVIVSNKQITTIKSTIEMIYPLQNWMWAPGSNNTQKQVSYFAAVKNINPPYSFEWRVNGTVAQVTHKSVRNATMVTLSDPAITWNDGAVLTLKVTDGSGNTKTFNSSLTFSAFGSKGSFDPMPPKAVPCLMSTGGDQLTTRVKDVTYPLNFRYFYLDSGVSEVHSNISVPYHSKTWMMLGSPGDNIKCVLEVGATDKGILPSNEFNLVAVQSRSNGWGLPVPIQGEDGRTFSVYIPTNIGSDPMSVFFYYIDQSVVPQQRIPVEFGHALGVLTQSPMSSAVIPDIMAGKEVEVYCAAIDADGRWWVTPVITRTIAAGATGTDWKRAPYTYSGQTFHQAATWSFTFKANGTWSWTGNGVSGVQSGDWKTPLGASSSGYSIRRVSSSGDPAYATNLNTSWVDLTNDKYITVRANMPPPGELDNWSYVVSQIEIRNNQTGVIVSGQLNIEAQSVREYIDGN